jgi:hypothetical protein
MNTNALLTESLQASIDIERSKTKLLRAACMLTIAQKAFKRYVQWQMYFNSYDASYRSMEPWTFINSKDQTLKRSHDAHAAYQRLMKSYRRILFQVFTNKN